MLTILVTGGCGYIGSHTIIDLIEHGFNVISIDNNICSNAKALDAVFEITGTKVNNHAVDLCSLDELEGVFSQYDKIDGIIHFAAFKSVPESVQNPLKYYHNNINGLLNVLACSRKYKVPNIIFSSSCSVYGNVSALPVTEKTPIGGAESPYAYTKQIGERLIEDFAVANPSMQHILLRYFNPGGAHPSAKLGQIPQEGAYSIVPLLVESLANVRGQFVVAGAQYDTPDGSCIRDYIHVMDVANAHTKALMYLLEKKNNKNCEAFNIGLGKGVSVFELIAAFDRATGQTLDYAVGPQRAGDISAIYADSSKAQTQLNWKPQYSVDDILSTAWNWYNSDYKLS